MADMPTEANKSKAPKCPICKAQAATAYMPFCSKRCADIDLGKWFTSSYTIPGSVQDDEAETAAKSPLDDEDETQ